MSNSRISDIIRTLNLEDATDIIRQAYHDQGYTGEFGEVAEFRYHNNKIELFAPDYTQYMLFGRGPGKMPPRESIQSWMDQYGITGNPWPIMRKIAEQGTLGNDFIDPVLPDVVQSVKLAIVPEITKLIVSTMMRMSRK